MLVNSTDWPRGRDAASSHGSNLMCVITSGARGSLFTAFSLWHKFNNNRMFDMTCWGFIRALNVCTWTSRRLIDSQRCHAADNCIFQNRNWNIDSCEKRASRKKAREWDKVRQPEWTCIRALWNAGNCELEAFEVCSASLCVEVCEHTRRENFGRWSSFRARSPGQEGPDGRTGGGRKGKRAHGALINTQVYRRSANKATITDSGPLFIKR